MCYLLSHCIIRQSKKGTIDYNRAHKFSMPLQVLMTNTNFCTKKAALDLAIDETTIPFGGCGDYVYNLRGKLVFLWNTTCIDVGCRYYTCKRILC